MLFDEYFSFFLYSYGLMRFHHDQNTFYQADVPRNVASTGVQSYSTSLSLSWNGDVCPNVFNGTCSDSQTEILSSGEYRIRFAALKHFGNSTNPNDFEVYRSPAFNLVY
jgi:hypothetical protein